MHHASPTPSTLVENLQTIPIVSDLTAPDPTSYSSLLLKKKLAMFENSCATTEEASHSSVSKTTPSINEKEPIKSASRRRKPLRPWSLSARVERPNSTVQTNTNFIEPISDNDDDIKASEMNHSSVTPEETNSNLDDDDHSVNNTWPRDLSTIEEILKLYRVQSNGFVQCIRCGCQANQDNLLEHVSIHYPYKCYSCGFYSDSSANLDKHNRTHTLCKSTSAEELPLPLSKAILTSTKPSETPTNTNSEKSTPSSKTKVHRCRQCSYVSSVKEDYWAHHRVHIRTDKILECPSCPFVTEYKHHLEYHLRNHLGSKPFKCSKCEYACVNLSMLRSHKKSHYRHLLFKCSNCSFESKQYPVLQEHVQIEGHEPLLDENIEEFLKEYSSGNLSSLNLTNHNSNSSSSTPPTLVPKLHGRSSGGKKRKAISQTSIPGRITKRTSSISSNASSPGAISPISVEEHQTELGTLVCGLCDYVAASKEGLGVHLFQHACKKNDLLTRSFLPNGTVDPTAKLMELFNGKLASFANTSGVTGQLNDFLAPYHQFLTQQLQSHLSSTSSLSSTSANMPPYHLDNNNNHAPSASLLNSGYSLLSSCIKSESNDNVYPTAKRQRKEPTNSMDGSSDERNLHSVDQQTQVDEWQIKRLFECLHCEIIFKDFAMYCTHKQFHYSSENPFRCAQCGEQEANKYDFFVHVAQQAHDLT